MWSELWNAWKYNHNVIVPKEFDFCWATCHIDKWDTVSFFHNAGVVDSKSAMFFKAGYIETLPYLEDLEIDDQRCSNKYFKAVKATGETSVLID
mgnify:FL=1|tara:strand:- start:253 stop:534 length:282 start_codon:yes stop_codon:yes gene_type:complete